MERDYLLDIIKTAVAGYEIKNADAITFESPLGEHEINGVPAIGLDSLEIIEISMELEKQTNKKCDDDKLENAKTVGDLINIFID